MKKFIIALLLTISCFCTAQTIEIKHKFYETKFDTILKQPVYTHYLLTKSMLDGSFKRTSFKPDPLVKNTMQGSTVDYSNGAYDKGHLSPNDDFRFDQDAQEQSMYYTNCVPQNTHLNKGTWLTNENYIRTIARNYDVEVWTGAIYEGSQENLGKLKVPVQMWKLIKYNGNYMAWLYPNKKPESKNIDDYKVDYHSLFKIIGLND